MSQETPGDIGNEDVDDIGTVELRDENRRPWRATLARPWLLGRCAFAPEQQVFVGFCWPLTPSLSRRERAMERRSFHRPPLTKRRSPGKIAHANEPRERTHNRGAHAG